LADEFGAALLQAGAEVIYLPVIAIAPAQDLGALDQALNELASYDWVLFTSANGVRASLDRLLATSGKIDWPTGIRVAAIGPKTAGALQAFGIEVDFMPDEFVAEAIPPGLGQMEGRKFLLLRADLARPDLAELIEAAGGMVDEVTAYRTVLVQPEPQALDALRSGVDILTFTSSSTVRNFKAILEGSGLDPARLPGSPRIACIGPITARTALELGLPADLVAEEYTIEGLVATLQRGPSDPSQFVRIMP
jgi:uroporphyrinogen III methyltransferase/synthase